MRCGEGKEGLVGGFLRRRSRRKNPPKGFLPLFPSLTVTIYPESSRRLERGWQPMQLVIEARLRRLV